MQAQMLGLSTDEAMAINRPDGAAHSAPEAVANSLLIGCIGYISAEGLAGGSL